MKTIEIKWSTEDVIGLADTMNIVLTEEQADKILDNLLDHHDADVGVNWGVIEYYIEDFLNEQTK